jgi:hypothetical protein
MLRSSTRTPVSGALVGRSTAGEYRSPDYRGAVLGFFSFTEVTDPSAHEAYNAWHQLDHLPEQFTLDGINFGRRWVRSPRCAAAEDAGGPLLERFHYMTLYLLRDRAVLPEFYALGKRLYDEDRFFAARKALLSGPFEVTGRWAAPRVAISPGAVPFRPCTGVYVVVGPPVDGEALIGHEGVAGAWQFAQPEKSRHVTVAFVDGDLWTTTATLGSVGHQGAEAPLWAGPLEGIDAFRWGWFATLTPQ